MAQDITLTHPTINSGTAIIMKGASLKYGTKTLNRTTPLTGSFSLAETQVSGFENPKLVLTGFIDTNDTSSNIITQSLMLQLLQNRYDGTSATTISLVCVTGNTDTYLLASDYTTQSIKVVIESFDISIDPSDSDLGHLWTYTLNLVETA